jgi:hypothetical protein
MSAQSCSVSRCSRRLRSKDMSGTSKKCPSFSIGLMLKCTSHTLPSFPSSSVSLLCAGWVRGGCAGGVSSAICKALSRISRRRRRRRRRRGPACTEHAFSKVNLHWRYIVQIPWHSLSRISARGFSKVVYSGVTVAMFSTRYQGNAFPETPYLQAEGARAH